MIRVTFADTASRDAFADRLKLTSKVDSTQLDMGWHLFQIAKKDEKAIDYHEVAILQSGPSAATEKEFIVKGQPANFSDHITETVADLGNGFYHVKSINGIALAGHVDSIEITGVPMTLLGNASTMTSMAGDATTVDPTSPQGQWARIRVASRYRPLAESFNTHGLSYQSKPELYIFDTGVNVGHPEFDYPGFESENFWTMEPGVFGDNIGHGTGVASMALGKNLGVANNAKLVIVKIANHTTQASILQIGQAIDQLVARASADPMKTRIVNMSWGVARSEYLDAKIQGLLDLGITVIAAAGNEGIDVENISPAGINEVITVAAIDKYDIPAGFNNISPSDAGVTTGHGLNLDIFAPGENVMVATGGGYYQNVSGTSFSAPLVAGVAAEIGALTNAFVPFTQMRDLILNTGTKDALLFEDARFSENQNNLVYLFTSDQNANYKLNNMTMYLGVHDDDGEPIVADMNSAMDLTSVKKVFPDVTPTWSLKWSDPELQSTYGQFVSIDSVTGVVTVTKPTTTLPPETKLKMVEFSATAQVSSVAMESPILFFFDFNPAYSETKASDITLALTNTNSISFYLNWYGIIK